MDSETIENLIDFAFDRYFFLKEIFDRNQVRRFFEIHQETTAIARDGEKIRAFLVWEYRGADAVEILGAAAIGSVAENIRLYRMTCKTLLIGKKIYWQRRKKCLKH